MVLKYASKGHSKQHLKAKERDFVNEKIDLFCHEELWTDVESDNESDISKEWEDKLSRKVQIKQVSGIDPSSETAALGSASKGAVTFAKEQLLDVGTAGGTNSQDVSVTGQDDTMDVTEKCL